MGDERRGKVGSRSGQAPRTPAGLHDRRQCGLRADPPEGSEDGRECALVLYRQRLLENLRRLHRPEPPERHGRGDARFRCLRLVQEHGREVTMHVRVVRRRQHRDRFGAREAVILSEDDPAEPRELGARRTLVVLELDPH